jgi:N-acetylmuramoyl-L-alanine amidase
MNLRKLIFTNNACYKASRTIVPKGIMVHSTGANNPNLKRYVGPDDGLLGKNQYNNHWNQDKPGGRQVCVHAFIGKLAERNSRHIPDAAVEPPRMALRKRLQRLRQRFIHFI